MQPHACAVDVRLSQVTTPLNVLGWEPALTSHPDRDFACYVVSGLRYGFHIGVDSSCTPLGAKVNMLSARQNPVDIMVKNILGPFPPSLLPGIHIYRFGCIPKKHQPEKWCLIIFLILVAVVSMMLCILHYGGSSGMKSCRIGSGLTASQDRY